jgi:hypothetical protein
LIREKISLKLMFGAVQGLMSFSAIVLALILKFNIFNAQSSLNILQETLNFDVTILLLSGIIFLIAALFLIYDWWESQ